MSNRHITKEQFSAGTTIDGNRLEKAYTDVQDHYNNLPLKSISSMVQNQINWNTFTPVALKADEDDYGPHTGFMHLIAMHPWVKYAYDGLRHNNEYIDAGNFDLQNRETYKGVGTNPELNPQVGIAEYNIAWEQTFRTDKTIIIKELTYLIMADAGWGRDFIGFPGYYPFWGQYSTHPLAATPGWSYYPNIFANFPDPQGNPEGFENVAKQFQALICVDSSLNLDTTDRMSKEAHIYNASAASFASDSHFNPTSGGMTRTKWLDPAQCGEQFLEAYPKTNNGGVFAQEVNAIPYGLVVKFRNIMLPVHAGGKVRLVFVMPDNLFNEFQYSTREAEAGEDITGLASPTGNIWNCGMTILEELEAK
jgi:hypothetical protein